MTDKIVTKFKPYDIGNGWGAFVDIESYTYTRKSLLPIIETDDFICDNKYSKYNIEKNKDIMVLIDKIDTATFITVLFVICVGFLFM